MNLEQIDIKRGCCGETRIKGRGFYVSLTWRAEGDRVTGTIVLRSEDGRQEETRHVELIPRFPQVFHFMGMYIHVSLAAVGSRRTLYASLPTKTKTHWRGPVAQWVREDEIKTTKTYGAFVPSMDGRS